MVSTRLGVNVASEDSSHSMYKKAMNYGTEKISVANKNIDQVIERVGERVTENLDKTYKTVLAAPVVTLAFMILITGWFAYSAKDFEEQIVGDVEIYLPEGAESTDLLLEVREQWSTDISLIYIQTSNAKYENEGLNVTDESILKEISWV
ncbi:MAG: hypothetical protein CMQ51_02085, partial [Gammaproteobacteria bacterium]|nr:hypothetical protein [Gammaproteobacteria bacterium]